MVEHKWGNPCTQQREHYSSCQWCDGGLELCSVCGAFEGATPDECPGEPMSAFQSDSVYHGMMNFRNGEWLLECADAMRHLHDTDKYMAEQGYERDGVNNAGNPKWIKTN